MGVRFIDKIERYTLIVAGGPVYGGGEPALKVRELS